MIQAGVRQRKRGTLRERILEMPIPNFDGLTFVAFTDISGFKEMMKNDQQPSALWITSTLRDSVSFVIASLSMGRLFPIVQFSL